MYIFLAEEHVYPLFENTTSLIAGGGELRKPYISGSW
jgi:hypothetical protein